MRSACLWLWRKQKKAHFRLRPFRRRTSGRLYAGAGLEAFASDAPADLVPAAYAISGVFDLAPLVHVSQNADLRLDEAEARRVSPLYWKVPAGRTLDAVVGSLESGEFLRQSKIIIDGWGARGVATRYEEIAGANHFTVVDPLSNPDSAMTRRIVDLAQMVSAL